GNYTRTVYSAIALEPEKFIDEDVPRGCNNPSALRSRTTWRLAEALNNDSFSKFLSAWQHSPYPACAIASRGVKVKTFAVPGPARPPIPFKSYWGQLAHRLSAHEVIHGNRGSAVASYGKQTTAIGREKSLASPYVADHRVR